MKKLLTLITLLLCATISFAQSNTIAVPAPKAVNLGEEAKWIPLFIQGVITTNFQQYSGMKVVDRQNADMVKAEQKLSENAAYDENNAIELGKLTSAKLIITGSITGKSSSYALMFSITDAETGETKASATVPNCLFSALENGDAANQISYDLMKGYGIKLDATAQSNLTKKATVMSGEVAAQASVAKGIVAEQSGSNIEALTYYIQAKKNDKKLGEATSRMASMTSVVTTGNFGANAKNLMKLRNDWDKLLRETAELIASNPPQFELKYFSDIEAQELTEKDYENGTMSFAVSSPYLKQVVDNENGRIATELLTTLKAIPQSKNWGDKINGFPWSYADDIGNNNWLQKSVNNTTDTFSFKVSLLDAKKKEIAKKAVNYTVEYEKLYEGLKIESDNRATYKRYGDSESELFIFQTVPVNDADTDKLYITITNSADKNISIRPVEKDVLPIRKAIECIKSGKHNGTVKIGGAMQLSTLAELEDDRQFASWQNKKTIIPSLDVLDLTDFCGIYKINYDYSRISSYTYMMSIHTLILPSCCREIEKSLYSEQLVIPTSITYIRFEELYSLVERKKKQVLGICYCGSKKQWDSIVSHMEERDNHRWSSINGVLARLEIFYDCDPIKVAAKVAAERKAAEEKKAAEQEAKKHHRQKLQSYYDSGVVPAEDAADLLQAINFYSDKNPGKIKKIKIIGDVSNEMGKINNALSSQLKEIESQKEIKARNHPAFKIAFFREEKLNLALDLSETEGLTILEQGQFKNLYFLAEVILPTSIVEIKKNAFHNCGFMTINYTGTKKQWKKIKIDKEGNEILLKTKINYEYKAK